MTVSTKAPAQKATTKKAQAKKVVLPKLGTKITDPAFRKLIVKSVIGTASNVRDDNGKKDNRYHTLKYTKGKKAMREVAQHMGPRECDNHKLKDVTELTNSKGTVYYFRTVTK